MSTKKKAAVKKTVKTMKTVKVKATKRKVAVKKATKATAAKKKVVKTVNSKPATKSQSALLGGLTSSERQHLAELIDQGRAPVVAESTEKVSVVFYVQDGVDKGDGKHGERRRPAFTVAMVAIGGELKGVGVAKVNPKDDEWSNERGRVIALARAVRGEAKLQ